MLPRDWPYIEKSEFIAAGELTWHVQRHASRGRGGPTFVLLHGTGSSAHSFADLIEGLTELGPVVNLDLPGHGFTQGGEKADLTLAYVAGELKKLCNVIGLSGDVVLVGHSAGATIAVQWAMPESLQTKSTYRIARVIGLNPSLVPPPALYTNLLGPLMAPIATSTPMTMFLATLATSSSMVDRLLDSTGSSIPIEQRERYRFLFSKSSHVQGSMRLMAGADIPQLLNRAKEIQASLTFLLASGDEWVREKPLTEIIHRYFPQAKLTVWPGGHALHEERPQEVVRFIQESVFTA